MKNRKMVAATVTFAAASLVSIAFTSQAFAQCGECAIYPDRDPFTQGLAITPSPAPAARPRRVVSHHHVTHNAHAELRRHAENHDRVRQ